VRGNKFKESGFSLVEVMVVMALIAVLATLAAPSYRVWIQNTRIRTTAESIQNGLQKAKTEALRNNARVSFTLNGDASWAVGCVNPTATCPANIETASKVEATSDIAINTDSGNMVITFTNLGMRDPAEAADEFNQVSIDMSSMSAADSRNLDVRVGPGGNVKMCDPEVVAPDLRAC